MENQEIVEVPIAWFRTLEKFVINAELSLEHSQITAPLQLMILFGHLSSAKTIIKYNNKI